MIMNPETDGVCPQAVAEAEVAPDPVPSSPLLGILALVIALGSIALASIWLVVVETELAPYTAICYRLGLAAILLTIWQGWLRLRGQGTQPQYDRGSILLLGITGLCFSASLVLLGWSLTQTTVANGTLLYNNMPVFTALLAWIFLRQRLNLKFGLGLLLSVTGVGAIGWSDLRLAAGDIQGDLAAIVASFLAAISLLCFERWRRSFSSGIVMLWVSWVGGILLLPWVIWQGESWWPHSSTVWLALLGLAGISQSLGQGLLTYCVGLFSARIVAVCMLLIPVFAALLAVILFDEQLSLSNGLGFGIVLAGIYLAVSAKHDSSASGAPTH